MGADFVQYTLKSSENFRLCEHFSVMASEARPSMTANSGPWIAALRSQRRMDCRAALSKTGLRSAGVLSVGCIGADSENLQ